MKTAIWSALLGIGLVCPAIVFVFHFPVTPEAHQGNLKSIFWPGWVIVMSTIVGPLLEELVYRGLLLQLVRRFAPVWVAIVGSSAVFAATHFMKGPAVVLIAFAMGCLFGWMMVRSRSPYPGFVCHAVFDFAAFLMGPLFGINDKVLAHPVGSTFSHPLGELFPAWWISLSIVIAMISFVMVVREVRLAEKTVSAGAA